MEQQDLQTVLQRVRDVLMQPTPLKIDCGLLCGRRCCCSHPGEETGMVLCPGEDGFCRDIPGFTLASSPRGQILRCQGSCNRMSRPLACRMFPLLPVVQDGMIHVEVARRAGSVCPLAEESLESFDHAFVDAVQLAGDLLLNHPETARWLEGLSREQAVWKALQHRMGAR